LAKREKSALAGKDEGTPSWVASALEREARVLAPSLMRLGRRTWTSGVTGANPPPLATSARLIGTRRPEAPLTAIGDIESSTACLPLSRISDAARSDGKPATRRTPENRGNPPVGSSTTAGNTSPANSLAWVAVKLENLVRDAARSATASGFTLRFALRDHLLTFV
jgi:hypothetical protein